MGIRRRRRPSHPTTRRLSAAVDQLQQRFRQLTSGNDELAEAAIEGLSALGPAALPQLANLLKSVDADVRWWGVRALAAIDDPSVPPLLITALEDESPPVRQAAVLGLRLRPSPQAIPGLTRALEDRDRLTAHLASDALAACGEEAIESLDHALHSSSSSIRIEAARALAEMDNPAVIPLLFRALDDNSALVNFWAEHGLTRLGVGMVFFKP